MPSTVLAEADDHPDLFDALLAYIEWHDKEVERLSRQQQRRR